MVFQIRFKGVIDKAKGIFREPFVIDEFADAEKDVALKIWNDRFAHDEEFYEFLRLMKEK